LLEGRRIVVVLPAYNAEKTLRQTLDALPRQVVDEILLTDDASRDDTVNLSRSLGIPTLVHERNRGYGGNQKMIASGEYDVVLGSRILGKGALAGGMPLYKYIANRALTFIENLLLGEKLSEYHTGYRAWSRHALETLPLERCSDDFVFDNQAIAMAVAWDLRIGEISCPTRYFEEASSINFRRSVTYGFGVLETSYRYRLHRMGVLRSPLFEGSPA
jgi:glycosyltransferase involved in cell wall biosynthesis